MTNTTVPAQAPITRLERWYPSSELDGITEELQPLGGHDPRVGMIYRERDGVRTPSFYLEAGDWKATRADGSWFGCPDAGLRDLLEREANPVAGEAPELSA